MLTWTLVVCPLCQRARCCRVAGIASMTNATAVFCSVTIVAAVCAMEHWELEQSYTVGLVIEDYQTEFQNRGNERRFSEDADG